MPADPPARRRRRRRSRSARARSGRWGTPGARPAPRASDRPVTCGPELPGQQSVELLAMVTPPFPMLVEQPLDHFEAEEPVTSDGLRGASVLKQRRELPLAPSAQRHPATLLPAGDD